MAGCHRERDTIPQLEDPGLSFCVGKHSPCLSILEQDTDPCQLCGGCSVTDLLLKGWKATQRFRFCKFITVVIVIVPSLEPVAFNNDANSFVVASGKFSHPCASCKTISQSAWLKVIAEFLPSVGFNHSAVVCFRGCQWQNFISTSD